jgi:hypothetical protein
MDPKVRAAIAAIGEEAWTPIRYPRAIWDDQLWRWVSDAQVAEVEYTAFTSRKGQAITARLIVRRVRDLSPQGQGELFAAWRYHAIFTDSPFETIQAEEHHRGHAQAEQVFADWTDGPLAHLPSGSFPANAAWLALAAITGNLLRAAGCLAGLACAKARGATLRRDLIDVAARTASTAAATSPSTCPMAGTASRNGPACSTPPPARPPLRPDQPRPGHRTPTAHTGHRQTANGYPVKNPRTSRRTVSGRKTTPATGTPR